MSIDINCPGCSASYRLADTLRGKTVRCKSCSETFIVRDKSSAPDRDEDEERIQTSPRPAKRILRDEEDEDTERPEPRRRPRKKRRDDAILPLVIVGGIAAGVVILGLGGVGIWALSRSWKSQAAQVAAENLPPRVAQPAQFPAPPQNQPAMPQPPGGIANPPMVPPANGPLAAQLTNGKVSGFGAQMEVTVDYRFTSGNPAGRRLFLFVKATKFGGIRQNYYLAELHNIGNQTQGTVRASGMTFGLEHGPFEMWIGEGSATIAGPIVMLSERDIRKISNVVTVAVKEHAPPGMPAMPGMPGGRPPFPRPPFGPRRIP